MTSQFPPSFSALLRERRFDAAAKALISVAPVPTEPSEVTAQKIVFAEGFIAKLFDALEAIVSTRDAVAAWRAENAAKSRVGIAESPAPIHWGGKTPAIEYNNAFPPSPDDLLALLRGACLRGDSVYDTINDFAVRLITEKTEALTPRLKDSIARALSLTSDVTRARTAIKACIRERLEQASSTACPDLETLIAWDRPLEPNGAAEQASAALNCLNEIVASRGRSAPWAETFVSAVGTLQSAGEKLPADYLPLAALRNSIFEVVTHAIAMKNTIPNYYQHPDAPEGDATCGLFGKVLKELDKVLCGKLLASTLNPQRGTPSLEFNENLASVAPWLLSAFGAEPWSPDGNLYQALEKSLSATAPAAAPAADVPGLTAPANPPVYLTPGQRNACEEIQVTAEVLWDGGWRSLPVRPRFSKLLVGASGIGKTFTVQHAARILNIPLLRLTYGDWLVMGARDDALHTLWRIHDFVDEHDCGIIHIDELDKVGSRDNAWDASVRVELFNILDGKPAGTGAGGTREWTLERQKKLHDRFLIVGSGTWQTLWTDRLRLAVGFGAGAPGTATPGVVEAIKASSVIPAELLQRFCAELCVLPPLTRNDAREAIAQLHMEHLGLESTPQVAAEIAESNLGMRWFEEFATRALIQNRRSPKAADKSGSAAGLP